MYVKEFKNITNKDINVAGGKGASLGEMYNLNINVPNGYVVLSNAFSKFLEDNNIYDSINELLNYEDINNVEKGDIIITSMTTPDYVAAMEKAKGFITDEGGVTCHAAIVSREFNVPCIVGTNNATKKIKNGQTIELDAYKGIVTIIE